MKKKKINIFGQYTQIPNALFLDERIPSHCINIYAVLQAHAGIDGRIFPSYKSIAEITHLHRATVIRLMKKLVFYGYVAKETRYSDDRGCITSNYYYLNPNPQLLCAKNVDKSPSYPQDSCKNATRGWSQNATPNKKEFMKKNTREKESIINNTLHAHAQEFPVGVGVGGNHWSLCVNDNEIIGQSGTKKQTSAFDSSVATHFVENCSAKKRDVFDDSFDNAKDVLTVKNGKILERSRHYGTIDKTFKHRRRKGARIYNICTGASLC